MDKLYTFIAIIFAVFSISCSNDLKKKYNERVDDRSKNTTIFYTDVVADTLLVAEDDKNTVVSQILTTFENTYVSSGENLYLNILGDQRVLKNLANYENYYNGLMGKAEIKFTSKATLTHKALDTTLFKIVKIIDDDTEYLSTKKYDSLGSFTTYDKAHRIEYKDLIGSYERDVLQNGKTSVIKNFKKNSKYYYQTNTVWNDAINSHYKDLLGTEKIMSHIAEFNSDLIVIAKNSLYKDDRITDKHNKYNINSKEFAAILYTLWIRGISKSQDVKILVQPNVHYYANSFENITFSPIHRQLADNLAILLTSKTFEQDKKRVGSVTVEQFYNGISVDR